MNNTTGEGMMMPHHHKMMMMHMTFYWGKNAEILFSGWPGKNNTGMYILSLVFVFLICFLVECVSHSQLIKPGTSNLAAGLIQTFCHAIRVGLANMAMLAIMSFNGGVFLAAMAGHSLGFLIFGSRIFKKSPPPPTNDYHLPPMSTCC
ncbi:hypothetical protein JCGZ_23754 [Jatropha curcas]|uniref:Copper transport protein n=1 Tax=Jatropha curcas TaxID=180498 RepID=A0A067L332_JATCU|nr:copper transporter 1 [Jatropha curcas]KDP42812.1 hypothetical protein JCGZ_23754 [Jatropha curcas]